MIFKYNESLKYFELKSIIQTLYDICLDLKDESIEYVIYPFDDIQIKLLTLQLSDLIERNIKNSIDFRLVIDLHKMLNIQDHLNQYQNSWKVVDETIQSIIQFMKTEGFKCNFYLNGPSKPHLNTYTHVKYPFTDHKSVFNKIEIIFEM